MLPLWLGALWGLIQGVMLLISYVTNQTAFPQPLGPKEESDLIERLATGSEEARQTLIERNLRLVAHIVKKYASNQEEVEDLISIGTIGLIKGINTFNPERAARLATYAARCIENEILMHLRSSRKLSNEQFLHDPIGSDKEGNEISLIDIYPSDDDVAEEVHDELEKERLKEWVDRLSRRERRVLEMRFGLNDGVEMTQKEVSGVLGISRSYVSRIEKRALIRLQRELAAEGYQ